MLYTFITLILMTELSNSKRFKAAFVENPSNYAAGNLLNLETLHLKRQPSAFLGPKTLRHLEGKCLIREEKGYEWQLCSFQNVTQTEKGSRWNPYRGILGVWSEWLIDAENNTFVSMSYTDGDECGSHPPRQVIVVPRCGSVESLAGVSETSTCQYEFTLESPSFCPSDGLRIYPTLSDSLRFEWDQIYTDYQNGIYTKLGYKDLLNKLLKKAGYGRDNEFKQDFGIDSSKLNFASTIQYALTHVNSNNTNELSCNFELAQLKAKIRRLEKSQAEMILEMARLRDENDQLRPKSL